MGLSPKEQKIIAKMCVSKGMNPSELKKMGIDITSFSPEEQAKLFGISAGIKLDNSINKTLHDKEPEI